MCASFFFYNFDNFWFLLIHLLTLITLYSKFLELIFQNLELIFQIFNLANLRYTIPFGKKQEILHFTFSLSSFLIFHLPNVVSYTLIFSHFWQFLICGLNNANSLSFLSLACGLYQFQVYSKVIHLYMYIFSDSFPLQIITGY